MINNEGKLETLDLQTCTTTTDDDAFSVTNSDLIAAPTTSSLHSVCCHGRPRRNPDHAELLEETLVGSPMRLEAMDAVVPNATASQIIWRSDNGQTMWFGGSNTIDGVEVYRRRDRRDGWALINKVQLNTVKYEMMGITEEDEENEKKRVSSRRYVQMLDMKTVSLDMVWRIAFMPWNPRLVIVIRIWERFFIYDCINQKMDCEIEFTTPRSRSDVADGGWE